MNKAGNCGSPPKTVDTTSCIQLKRPATCLLDLMPPKCDLSVTNIFTT